MTPLTTRSNAVPMIYLLLYGRDETWDLGTWHATGLTTVDEAFALYEGNAHRIGISGWRRA